jgi:hypothetical protein
MESSAAQADAEHLGVLVVAHGQRHLEILVGMQAVGILEVAVA